MLTDVNGRAFNAYSNRQKVLFKTSSVRQRVPRMVYPTLLKLRDNLAHMTPFCSALGQWNFPLVLLCASSASMLLVFHFSVLLRISFSVPIKFVSLSDQIISGVPRRETKRSTPITQELVFMVGKTSTWTVRVVRQVKRRETPPLLGSRTKGYVKWTKVTNPGVGEQEISASDAI